MRFATRLCLILALLCTGASGKTLTVDPSASAFRTISAAARVAGPGDVVLIRAGTYRETVRPRSGTASAPITFRGQGEVIITGADVLSDFHREGDAWWTPWKHRFIIDHYDDGSPVMHHPPESPRWGRAEMVWIDGNAAWPLLSLAEGDDHAQPGPDNDGPVNNIGPTWDNMRFFADTARARLWLRPAKGDDRDLSDLTVEAAVRPLLFGVDGMGAETVNHVVVENITFRHAANFPQRPAVWLPGIGNKVIHCVIEANAGTGVLIDGELRDSMIANNGHTGGGANGDGSLNIGSTWTGNSWKPINRGWDAGGFKLTQARGVQFSRCLFDRNGGPGLWFDINVRDARLDHCAFTNNEGQGLYIEISRGVTVTDCDATGNAMGVVGPAVEDNDWNGGGIGIAESFDITLQRCRMTDNLEGLSIREQGPRDAGGETEFTVHNITVTDCTIADNRSVAVGLWYDTPGFGPHPTAPPETRPRLRPESAGIHFKNCRVRGDVQLGVPWRPKSRTISFEQWLDLSR